MALSRYFVPAGKLLFPLLWRLSILLSGIASLTHPGCARMPLGDSVESRLKARYLHKCVLVDFSTGFTSSVPRTPTILFSTLLIRTVFLEIPSLVSAPSAAAVLRRHNASTSMLLGCLPVQLCHNILNHSLLVAFFGPVSSRQLIAIVDAYIGEVSISPPAEHLYSGTLEAMAASNARPG